MQNRHPMQRCMSIITMPSSLFHVALVGQTLTQGGLVQWLQRTRKFFFLNAFGKILGSLPGKAWSYVSFQIHLISSFGFPMLGTLL
jgi:hypothetical protein